MSGAPNLYGRIWRTASGGYVGDGHIDAELLVAGPADPLPADFDPETFEGGTVLVVEDADPDTDGIEVEGVEDERPEEVEPGVQADDDTSGLPPAVEKPAAKRGKK